MAEGSRRESWGQTDEKAAILLALKIEKPGDKEPRQPPEDREGQGNGFLPRAAGRNTTQPTL